MRGRAQRVAGRSLRRRDGQWPRRAGRLRVGARGGSCARAPRRRVPRRDGTRPTTCWHLVLMPMAAAALEVASAPQREPRPPRCGRWRTPLKQGEAAAEPESAAPAFASLSSAAAAAAAASTAVVMAAVAAAAPAARCTVVAADSSRRRPCLQRPIGAPQRLGSAATRSRRERPTRPPHPQSSRKGRRARRRARCG